MGTILMKYYKYVGDEQGMDGQVRLAKLTKIPSTRAAMETDSRETVEAFKRAISELTGKPAPTF